MPDAILSSYDGLSTGTIEMLKEQKITAPILFSGQDAELAACRNIVAGTQAMTVYKSVRNLAYKAAELSMKLAKKEKLTDVSTTVFNGKKAGRVAPRSCKAFDQTRSNGIGGIHKYDRQIAGFPSEGSCSCAAKGQDDVCLSLTDDGGIDLLPVSNMA